MRNHAEHRSAYTINTSRLAFSLDIPSDVTPAFSLAAGAGGLNGGLEWRVRLAFLVATPPSGYRRHPTPRQVDEKIHGEGQHQSVHLLPSAVSIGNEDDLFFAASTGLCPLLPVQVGDEGADGGRDEMEAETVECEVPINVLAGNTAFVVRPSVYVV